MRKALLFFLIVASSFGADLARVGTGGVGSISNAYALLSGSAGPWTVCLWFRNDSLGTNGYLFDTYDGSKQWAVITGYGGSGIVEYYCPDCTGTDPRTGSQITIPDGGWHHVCYRKGASGASTWDKFLDGTKTSINASISFTEPTFTVPGTQIFTFSVAGAQNLVGALQWVAAWTTNLSDGEITSLAACTAPASIQIGSEQVAWYMNGSSPETDFSGNGRDGTVSSIGTTTGNCTAPAAGGGGTQIRGVTSIRGASTVGLWAEPPPDVASVPVLETLIGTPDGVNTMFSLSAAPVGGVAEIFRNGILQNQGPDYSFSGVTVTFAPGAVPQQGDTLTAYYLK